MLYLNLYVIDGKFVSKLNTNVDRDALTFKHIDNIVLTKNGNDIVYYEMQNKHIVTDCNILDIYKKDILLVLPVLETCF